MTVSTEADDRPTHAGRKRVARRLGSLAAALLAIVYGGISLYSAHVLTSPKPRAPWVDPKGIDRSVVDWSTTTADGQTLRGWYFPTAERRRLVIFVHGLWDCWDVLAPQAADLHRRGFDVLAFDLRGHGRSDPSRLSMGRDERLDLRAALRWAAGQGFTPDRIGWVGYSLGGATLLMEAAENPEIRVGVVDSAFGDLPEVLDDQLARHSGLPRLFNPGILLAARLAFGARTDDLIPIRSARRWGSRPLLVIHGDADRIVPVDHARRIAEAAGPSCRLAILPGVEHIEGHKADPSGYTDRLAGFFGRHLDR